MRIAVVTDSTAYLPADLAERFALRIVSLHVTVDGADTLDEHSFTPDDLAAAFARKHRVTTSGATSDELARAYQDALDSGADGVVSIHLSQQLSQTCDAARLAASQVDSGRVRVVDSRSAGMGLGFAVLAAAEYAAAGADLGEVEAAATRAAARAVVRFSVQTLEYLRRGGRIGAATAVLGTALAIKPLLHVNDGRIEALEKVRTTTRAMSRLLEITVLSASSGPNSFAVHHMAAQDRAEQLAADIRRRVPHCQDCVVSEVGPVIGAHIGPGALGVVLLPGGWRSI